MAELDRFEARFAAAYLRYLDEAPTAVDAAAVARMAAAQPRTRVIARPWALLPVRGLAWVLLGALLLAAMGAAALLVGSQLPAPAFACPDGTSPDAPGPVSQARPQLEMRSMLAFDRRAGRIVLVVEAEDTSDPHTWTFDVCANTWTRMQAAGGPAPSAGRMLVYDAASDLTIAVDDRATWAYDLDADHWDRKSDAPSGLRALVYDPVADLVVASDNASPIGLWAYDVDADQWTLVPLTNPTPRVKLMAYDASVDKIVAARLSWDESTWLFDPRTGTWSEPATGIHRAQRRLFHTTAPGGSHAYDDSMGRTVVIDGGLKLAYDASAHRWHTLGYADSGYGIGPAYRVGHPWRTTR